MTTRNDNPKVFISYSWSSPQHEEFVLTLAGKLMADGVHILLDKWDLKEGHDKYAFMEQMVTDPNVSKVLIISDKKYAEKADNRHGGVGTESQIISNEVYTRVNQEKFIPIVTEYENNKPCLPIFLKSRIYVDLSNDENFYDEYEKLLRNIFDRPKLIRPVLGKPPSFLFDDSPTQLDTASVFSSLKDAIEKEKKLYKKLENDFLNQLLETLETLRITTDSELDNKIVESISNFKPYRDQFVYFIQLLCDFDLFESSKENLFKFLESVLALHEAPNSMNSYNDHWFENYKYISAELFLYLITVLIKSGKYDCIDYFLSEKYYLKGISGQKIKGYCAFNNYLDILDKYRNQRLKLNRISITADLLHDAADIKGISFEDIMQTDFILCIRSVIHSNDYHARWFPRSLVYKHRWNGESFEIFLRAESPRYFEIVKKLFQIESKADLTDKLVGAYKTHNLDNWKFGYEGIPFKSYLNLDKLYEG